MRIEVVNDHLPIGFEYSTNWVSLERKFPIESIVGNGVRICRKFDWGFGSRQFEGKAVVTNGVVVAVVDDEANSSGVRINGAPMGNGLKCLGNVFGSR